MVVWNRSLYLCPYVMDFPLILYQKRHCQILAFSHPVITSHLLDSSGVFEKMKQQAEWVQWYFFWKGQTDGSQISGFGPHGILLQFWVSRMKNERRKRRKLKKGELRRLRRKLRKGQRRPIKHYWSTSQSIQSFSHEGWVFLVPGMGFSLPSRLFFLDLVFQFLPRVFSVPFGFFGSRRGCFRFPSKHGVSGSHLWVFSVPVFFWPFLFVMGASASVPFLSWVFSVAPPRCCCCCCCWSVSWRGVEGEGAAPPPQMHRWQRWWWSLSWTCCWWWSLSWTCCCCCCGCCCGCCCCCCWSVLFWILWMVLVLVVLVPWEEATLKNKKAGGGLGVGGEGAAPPPQMHRWQRSWWSLFWTSCCCCCGCCCCCWSLLFWILWMVLVLVVLVPWEEATLKNKKAGGGLGVGGEGAAPPAQMHRWQRWWWSLSWTCCCCCCSCWSVLFWILWMVLVLVVLVPWKEATLKNKKAGGGLGGRAQRLPPDASLTTMMVVFVLNLLLLLLLVIVVLDIVDGTGAGGVGAVRGGNLKK